MTIFSLLLRSSGVLQKRTVQSHVLEVWKNPITL